MDILPGNSIKQCNFVSWYMVQRLRLLFVVINDCFLFVYLFFGVFLILSLFPHQALCLTWAILRYNMFVSVFCCMLVEALHLYRMIVIVFGVDTNLSVAYTVISFGKFITKTRDAFVQRGKVSMTFCAGYRSIYEELVSKTSYIQSDMLLIFIIDSYGNYNKF